nr:amino acid permease [Streptococcus anginosus]
LAGIFSLYFILMLPILTKIMVTLWLIVGLLVYIFYGVKHSKLQNQESYKK